MLEDNAGCRESAVLVWFNLLAITSAYDPSSREASLIQEHRIYELEAILQAFYSNSPCEGTSKWFTDNLLGSKSSAISFCRIEICFTLKLRLSINFFAWSSYTLVALLWFSSLIISMSAFLSKAVESSSLLKNFWNSRATDSYFPNEFLMEFFRESSI